MNKNRDRLKVPRSEAHNNKKRPARVLFNQGSKLKVAECYKRKGFHQHFFVDRAGELESATAAWYEFVTDDQGRKITVPAGQGLTHYLMEIDQETYDQDMARQQEMLTDTTKKAVKVKKDQGEYSPEGEELSITKEII